LVAFFAVFLATLARFLPVEEPFAGAERLRVLVVFFANCDLQMATFSG
jgi:hypothetical protein